MQWHPLMIAGFGIMLPCAWAVAQAGPSGAAESRPEAKEGREGRADWLVYVGTYTGPKSKGIYLLRMNPETGELRAGGVAAEVTNPSFLAVHPNRRFLYAVGEIYDTDGKRGGSVRALAISPETGMLNLLNQQPSGGSGPCYVSLDSAGRNALVANYGGGTVAVLPVGKDGRLFKPASVIQHHGSGPHAKRQQVPRAHAIDLDLAGRFALAADLGADKIFIYRFDPAGSILTPNDPPAVSPPPGSGPRHLAIHPSGKFVYVINELASTVTAFSYDAKRGALREIETVSTLPEGFKGENTTAEMQMHPSGRFLYGSNRGHDSVAIFAIDAGTGRLMAVGHQSTQGKTPRHFAIAPGGGWLLAANQGSDLVVAFRIDAKTGRLTPTGQAVEVPTPVCVAFVSAEGQ